VRKRHAEAGVPQLETSVSCRKAAEDLARADRPEMPDIVEKVGGWLISTKLAKQSTDRDAKFELTDRLCGYT
jgi:hypothetical protein